MGEPGGPIPDAGMPEGKRQPRRVAQVRSARSVVCRITLLDGTLFQTDVDKRAFGQILFDKTCDNLDLLEKDYFGLSYIDPATKLRNWLNNEKKISKQMKGLAWEFNFEVKFYPSDPQQLHEDLTRYQLCLQIRNDIVSGKLPCSFVTYALLGSYTVQSELGDFEVEEFGPGTEYIRKMKFAPRQDRELLKKIADLHKTHRGQTPEEAELHFLENAKKLAMFGVDLSDARDGEGVEIQLGVCASGIIVFREKLQINKFVWPKIVKMSYKRKKFYMKLRSGEFEDFQSLIAFKFAHVGLAKRLWKVCVENHAFFRNREPDSPSQRRGFLKLGSKFRYSGRTQFQTKQAMAAVDRPSPYFDRVLSKRATYHGRTPHKSLEDEFYRPRPEPRHHAPRVEEHFIDRKPPPVRKPVPEPEIMDEKRHSSEDEDEEEEEDEREEEPADRKSRMEKIHAVPTPLAAVMLGQKKEDHPVENNNVERPPPRRRSYDEDSMEKVPIEDDMVCRQLHNQDQHYSLSDVAYGYGNNKHDTNPDACINMSKVSGQDDRGSRSRSKSTGDLHKMKPIRVQNGRRERPPGSQVRRVSFDEETIKSSLSQFNAAASRGRRVSFDEESIKSSCSQYSQSDNDLRVQDQSENENRVHGQSSKSRRKLFRKKGQKTELPLENQMERAQIEEKRKAASSHRHDSSQRASELKQDPVMGTHDRNFSDKYLSDSVTRIKNPKKKTKSSSARSLEFDDGYSSTSNIPNLTVSTFDSGVGDMTRDPLGDEVRRTGNAKLSKSTAKKLIDELSKSNYNTKQQKATSLDRFYVKENRAYGYSSDSSEELSGRPDRLHFSSSTGEKSHDSKPQESIRQRNRERAKELNQNLLSENDTKPRPRQVGRQGRKKAQSQAPSATDGHTQKQYDISLDQKYGEKLEKRQSHDGQTDKQMKKQLDISLNQPYREKLEKRSDSQTNGQMKKQSDRFVDQSFEEKTENGQSLDIQTNVQVNQQLDISLDQRYGEKFEKRYSHDSQTDKKTEKQIDVPGEQPYGEKLEKGHSHGKQSDGPIQKQIDISLDQPYEEKLEKRHPHSSQTDGAIKTQFDISLDQPYGEKFEKRHSHDSQIDRPMETQFDISLDQPYGEKLEKRHSHDRQPDREMKKQFDISLVQPYSEKLEKRHSHDKQFDGRIEKQFDISLDQPYGEKLEKRHSHDKQSDGWIEKQFDISLDQPHGEKLEKRHSHDKQSDGRIEKQFDISLDQPYREKLEKRHSQNRGMKKQVDISLDQPYGEKLEKRRSHNKRPDDQMKKHFDISPDQPYGEKLEKRQSHHSHTDGMMDKQFDIKLDQPYGEKLEKRNSHHSHTEGTMNKQFDISLDQPYGEKLEKRHSHNSLARSPKSDNVYSKLKDVVTEDNEPQKSQKSVEQEKSSLYSRPVKKQNVDHPRKGKLEDKYEDDTSSADKRKVSRKGSSVIVVEDYLIKDGGTDSEEKKAPKQGSEIPIKVTDHGENFFSTSMTSELEDRIVFSNLSSQATSKAVMGSQDSFDYLNFVGGARSTSSTDNILKDFSADEKDDSSGQWSERDKLDISDDDIKFEIDQDSKESEMCDTEITGSRESEIIDNKINVHGHVNVKRESGGKKSTDETESDESDVRELSDHDDQMEELNIPSQQNDHSEKNNHLEFKIHSEQEVDSEQHVQSKQEMQHENDIQSEQKVQTEAIIHTEQRFPPEQEIENVQAKVEIQSRQKIHHVREIHSKSEIYLEENIQLEQDIESGQKIYPEQELHTEQEIQTEAEIHSEQSVQSKQKVPPVKEMMHSGEKKHSYEKNRSYQKIPPKPEKHSELQNQTEQKNKSDQKMHAEEKKLAEKENLSEFDLSSDQGIKLDGFLMDDLEILDFEPKVRRPKSITERSDHTTYVDVKMEDDSKSEPEVSKSLYFYGGDSFVEPESLVVSSTGTENPRKNEIKSDDKMSGKWHKVRFSDPVLEEMEDDSENLPMDKPDFVPKLRTNESDEVHELEEDIHLMKPSLKPYFQDSGFGNISADSFSPRSDSSYVSVTTGTDIDNTEFSTGTDRDDVDLATGTDKDNVDLATGIDRDDVDLTTGTGADNVDHATGTVIDDVDLTTGTDRDDVDLTTGTDADGVDIATGTGTDNVDHASGIVIDNVHLTTGTDIDNVDLAIGTDIDNVDLTTGTDVKKVVVKTETQTDHVSITTDFGIDNVAAPTGTDKYNVDLSTGTNIDKVDLAPGTDKENVAVKTEIDIDHAPITTDFGIDNVPATTGTDKYNVDLSTGTDIDDVDLAPGTDIDNVDLSTGTDIDHAPITTDFGIDNVTATTVTDIDNVDLSTGTDIDNVDLAPGTDIDNVDLSTGTDIDHAPITTDFGIDNVTATTVTDIDNVDLSTGADTDNVDLSTGTDIDNVDLSTGTYLDNVPITRVKDPYVDILVVKPPSGDSVQHAINSTLSDTSKGTATISSVDTTHSAVAQVTPCDNRVATTTSTGPDIGNVAAVTSTSPTIGIAISSDLSKENVKAASTDTGKGNVAIATSTDIIDKENVIRLGPPVNVLDSCVKTTEPVDFVAIATTTNSSKDNVTTTPFTGYTTDLPVITASSSSRLGNADTAVATVDMKDNVPITYKSNYNVSKDLMDKDIKLSNQIGNNHLPPTNHKQEVPERSGKGVDKEKSLKDKFVPEKENKTRSKKILPPIKNIVSDAPSRIEISIPSSAKETSQRETTRGYRKDRSVKPSYLEAKADHVSKAEDTLKYSVASKSDVTQGSDSRHVTESLADLDATARLWRDGGLDTQRSDKSDQADEATPLIKVSKQISSSMPHIPSQWTPGSTVQPPRFVLPERFSRRERSMSSLQSIPEAVSQTPRLQAQGKDEETVAPPKMSWKEKFLNAGKVNKPNQDMSHSMLGMASASVNPVYSSRIGSLSVNDLSLLNHPDGKDDHMEPARKALPSSMAAKESFLSSRNLPEGGIKKTNPSGLGNLSLIDLSSVWHSRNRGSENTYSSQEHLAEKASGNSVLAAPSKSVINDGEDAATDKNKGKGSENPETFETQTRPELARLDQKGTRSDEENVVRNVNSESASKPSSDQARPKSPKGNSEHGNEESDTSARLPTSSAVHSKQEDWLLQSSPLLSDSTYTYRQNRYPSSRYTPFYAYNTKKKVYIDGKAVDSPEFKGTPQRRDFIRETVKNKDEDTENKDGDTKNKDEDTKNKDEIISSGRGDSVPSEVEERTQEVELSMVDKQIKTDSSTQRSCPSDDLSDLNTGKKEKSEMTPVLASVDIESDGEYISASESDTQHKENAISMATNDSKTGHKIIQKINEDKPDSLKKSEMQRHGGGEEVSLRKRSDGMNEDKPKSDTRNSVEDGGNRGSHGNRKDDDKSNSDSKGIVATDKGSPKVTKDVKKRSEDSPQTRNPVQFRYQGQGHPNNSSGQPNRQTLVPSRFFGGDQSMKGFRHRIRHQPLQQRTPEDLYILTEIVLLILLLAVSFIFMFSEERSRHEPRNTEPQPPLEQPPPPPSQTFDPPKLLSKEERKRREKEEKEMKRKQKEEEKRKKKEADREKKQKEKEKKKSKGKEKIGKEWQQAVAVAVTNEGEETVERKHIPKRMSSFEEQKHEEARRGSKSGSETEDRRDEERAPAADKGDNSSDKDEPRSNEASGHNSEQDDVEDDDKSNPNTSRVGEEFDL